MRKPRNGNRCGALLCTRAGDRTRTGGRCDLARIAAFLRDPGQGPQVRAHTARRGIPLEHNASRAGVAPALGADGARAHREVGAPERAGVWQRRPRALVHASRGCAQHLPTQNQTAASSWRPPFAFLTERATGLEPATSSLGSWHSTTELRPQILYFQMLTKRHFSQRPFCGSFCGSLWQNSTATVNIFTKL